MSADTVSVNIPAEESRYYPIIIGANVINDLGSLIREYTKAAKILVVTNNTVDALFGDKIKDSLKNENLKFEFVILEDGERFKNIKSLESIWTKAIEFRLERKDAIVALGGGVIGDVAGFAAATYLRGIDFIQVPTTLLAQVDSSVGGKVAINNKLGKNLIGAFYQPKFALTDITTLNSLPVEELKVGLAEVLKYSFIEKSCNFSDNCGFSDYLREKKDEIFSLELDAVQELVKHCCNLKASVVNQDEKESGLRAILNFGHTIGHAVEKCSNYENISHGEAVAIGMRGAFHIAGDLKLIDEDYLDSCLNLINLYGLDYKIQESINPENLIEAMFLDKKVQSGKIRFILPIDKARVEIFNDINEDILLSAIKKLY